MKIRSVLLTSAAVFFCTASMSATNAHSWVSGSGSDSNACTFVLPCATFAGALTKTTASGIITAMDAGDFGPVSISKSVTIDGNNLGSITYSGSSGSVISITSSSANVTVQNLTINGMGTATNGIDVASGGIVIVDNSRIMNFVENGILYKGAGNLTVENSRIESFSGTNVIGILIDSNAAENVVVRNTVIDASPVSEGNSGFVVNPGGPVQASLQNVTIMDAGNIAVIAETGNTQITGSVITQSIYGVYSNGGATISVASSMITSNSTGVYSDTGSKIRLDNNDIYDNTTAIANGGGIVKTSTTNKVSGAIAVPAADISESVTF